MSLPSGHITQRQSKVMTYNEGQGNMSQLTSLQLIGSINSVHCHSKFQV